MIRTTLISLLSLLFIIPSAFCQEDSTTLGSSTFSGLKFRSIGPALMSGRIADIAIHPEDENVWYVAVGSGGVWKTKNAGTTWTPIFDKEKSYSIGCVTIDPNNPHRIWVGSGENVGGRHVGYGDGIYLSQDGGKNWKNMGLKASEHISRIIVHPEKSDVVWAAVQGPLWSKGGERGLFKTVDGGKNWKQVLGDSEWTGVTEVVVDPRDPDILYAATWDRHRTVAAYMGGGPGTGLHKSTDGGETWTQLKQGLPKSNMGKIGLAISSQKPDELYAAIELDHRKGGVYKSFDGGMSWQKQSDAVSGATGPHYYQELYACPHNHDRLYLVDVRMQISNDGGKTFERMSEVDKHSDNHAIVFKQSDPDYLLVGTDGGLYESFDLAKNWRFFDNLPLTQFYKVAVDDAEPFYNVYGGTQDNSTQGGPSRTDNVQGIQNSDWRIVLNWDGHQPATEPGNPNIMYGQRQEGTLSRIDLVTGEIVDIQPQADKDETYERYNWDAPIFISPHSPTRVYFASQRLWRSEDRGDTWQAVSPDLTRNENRFELPIMGRQQSWNNAWDLYAMSNYNTITAIAESPILEDLIYIGSDDGLIHVTSDGGENWQKIMTQDIPGAPERAYVNDIKADLFDTNTVYVVLDNHKTGDFLPYLYKSTDRGQTWTSIASDLPERHIIWRIVQDHVDEDLLFLGTEFGVFCTINGGISWFELTGDLPTISFRDLAIQRRENDLVCASFGRSFYILDDYSCLRHVDEAQLVEESKLFPVKDTWWYIPRPHLSFYGRGSQGASHYIAKNPSFGAVFTYYLHEGYKSQKQVRLDEEKKLNEDGRDIPFPGWEALEAENNETADDYWLVIRNAKGELVRKLKGKNGKGFHRVAWNLRYPSPNEIDTDNPERQSGRGFLVSPGTYSVELLVEDDGQLKSLSPPETFEVKPLRKGALEGRPQEVVDAFWSKYAQVNATNNAVSKRFSNLKNELQAIKKSLEVSQLDNADFNLEYDELLSAYHSLNRRYKGDANKNQTGQKNDPTIDSRLWDVARGIGGSTYGPTPSHEKMMELIEEELGSIRAEVIHLSTSVKELMTRMMNAGGVWIEGLPLPD